MNVQRLWNFAKYDLATNKVFYRNMALMTFGVMIGLAGLSFWARWGIYHIDPYAQDISLPGHFSNTFGTQAWMITAISILITAFAGCSFHSLRKRTMRLSELTLPASNLEKFVWHVGLGVGGGIVLTLCALLAADLVNYLLHLMTYGNQYTYSLTTRVLNTVLLETIPIGGKHIMTIKVFIFTSALTQVAAFVYGNTVKYRYNIIFTHLTLMVITIIGLMLMAQIAEHIAEAQAELDILIAEEQLKRMKEAINMWFTIGSIGFTLLGGLLLWLGYRRYGKAQITSRLNK